MDAWLPEYTSDSLGTNLVVTRSSVAADILNDGAHRGEVTLFPETPARVAASQSAVVKNKTEGLAHRLWVAERNGVETPRKRVEAMGAEGKEAQLWETQAEASRVGPQAWRESGTLEEFLERMRPYGYSSAAGNQKQLRGRLSNFLRKLLRVVRTR